MLWIAVLFFSLAAVLGLWLISYLLQNKETPKGLAFIHGPLGAIGIVFLLLYAIFYSGSFFIPVIVFIMAAFLGFILIYRDLTGKTLPKWLAILHGLTAVIGFVIVLVLIFMQ